MNWLHVLKVEIWHAEYVLNGDIHLENRVKVDPHAFERFLIDVSDLSFR